MSLIHLSFCVLLTKRNPRDFNQSNLKPSFSELGNLQQFIFLIQIIYYGREHMPWHTCGGQKTTLRISCLLLWVLEIQFRWSSLHGENFYLLSHFPGLTGPSQSYVMLACGKIYRDEFTQLFCLSELGKRHSQGQHATSLEFFSRKMLNEFNKLSKNFVQKNKASCNGAHLETQNLRR